MWWIKSGEIEADAVVEKEVIEEVEAVGRIEQVVDVVKDLDVPFEQTHANDTSHSYIEKEGGQFEEAIDPWEFTHYSCYYV